MGLSEPILTTITKPFTCLSHCKVSCDSPCCTKTCGGDNHCVFCLISIHTKTLTAIAVVKILIKLLIQMILQKNWN